MPYKYNTLKSVHRSLIINNSILLVDFVYILIIKIATIDFKAIKQGFVLNFVLYYYSQRFANNSQLRLINGKKQKNT